MGVLGLMTVIVYRNGVMASDSVVSCGGVQVSPVRKVVRTEDGRLWGLAGVYSEVCNFITWLDGGMVGDMPMPSERDGCSTYSVLCSWPDGRLRQLEHGGWEELDMLPYAALGSGAAVALGALWAGADAWRSVEAAIAHQAGIGGGVQAVQR